MGNALMAIGTNFFFIPVAHEDTPAFESVSKESTAIWTAQGRLNRDQAMQFTGPGEEVITVRGHLYPELYGGFSTMVSLRADLRAGKPLPVVSFSAVSNDGFAGSVVGNYVIRKLSKENTKFKSDGTPRQIDFSIDLALYGDDVNGTQTTSASSSSSDQTGGSVTPASTDIAPSTTSSGSTYTLWT